MPLLTFDVDPTPAPPPSPPRPIPAKKPWTSYIFAILVVLVLLLPQPSILLLLVQHYLQALRSPWTFAFHLVNIHLITFFTFCSFIVCISRHPGPVSGSAAGGSGGGFTNGKNLSGRAEAGHGREDGASDALLADAEEGQGADDGDQPPEYFQPSRWCRHCNAPKPERAHHCSICDICVLKMDHHCPWLANKCIGHRTYTNFVHFLFCTTLLSCYVAWLGGHTIYYFMTADVPIMTHKSTPLHALFLTFLGTVFSITMGAFFGYHVYLVATNQTTLENISPFLLLRYLPPPPPLGAQLSPPDTPPSVPASTTTTITSTTTATATGTPRPSSTSPRPSSVSSATRFAAPYHFPPPVYHPPEEHELNYRQRRKVRRAHHRIRLYDLGWKRNLSEFLGLPLGWDAADADEVVARRVNLKGDRSVWVKVRKWFALVVWGGYAHGDGRTFPRNPEADGLLLRLAKELEVERIREREGR